MTDDKGLPERADSVIDWHRLFGMALKDDFEGLPLEVILEMDLAEQQQFLDVVILRRGNEPISRTLPDGFDSLAAHNVLTFKSLHEPLDAWAIRELIGHYVNYRKQATPANSDMLPEDQFQMMAVATRFPSKLAKEIELQPLQAGVYQLKWGLDWIRVIVLSELPPDDRNVALNLLSSKKESSQFAMKRVAEMRPSLLRIVSEVLEYHPEWRIDMPYTSEDFTRDFVREHLDCLPPEERLRGLPPEERLKGFSAEELEACARRLREQLLTDDSAARSSSSVQTGRRQ